MPITLNPILQRRIKTLQQEGYYVVSETVMYPDGRCRQFDVQGKLMPLIKQWQAAWEHYSNNA